MNGSPAPADPGLTRNARLMPKLGGGIEGFQVDLFTEVARRREGPGLALGPIPRSGSCGYRSSMTTPSPLRILIRAKLADGGLPINSIPRVWGGPGDGETCDACETIITKDEFVMEGIGVEGSRQPIQLHVACFRLWDEERRQILGAGAEGKAR